VKILHVVENLERGGLERMVVDLAARQRADGHEVRVACVFNEGLLAAELDTLGVPVVACGKRDGLDLRAMRRLRQAMRAAQGGVLHTHNAAAHYLACAAGLGLAWRRVVNTRHGMGAADARSRKEWLYRRAMPRTDVVAAVCEAARARFQAQGVAPRGRLLAVGNGIRIDAFAPGDAQARGALAHALDLGEGARIVGSVGRLNPVKDQAMLLDAFARVHAAMPHAALVIAGEGPARPGLEAQARELGVAHRVRLLGDRHDVAALLRGFELFALSSRSEGYSIALLEACAAGLPIVATDVGGNGEIVMDGRNGLLVPAQDPVAFARAMAAVLGDPAMAARMGATGQAWAAVHGSLRAMAARYEALYGAGA
jgi:glycosyltransferase involved in cell wall biosynthesis